MSYSSIEKLCNYIGFTVKEDTVIKLPGKELNYRAKKGIVIQPSLFFSDYCVGCGVCCANYDTAYVGNEMELLNSDVTQAFEDKNLDVSNQQVLLNMLETLNIEVNGKSKIMYRVKEQGSVNHGIHADGKPNRLLCRWIKVREDGHKHCGIHPIRSITCGFPHMEMFKRMPDNGYTYLGIKQYGRNHQLGCPVVFEENVFHKEVLLEKIYWLKRLQSACHYLEIPTWLDDVIKWLEDNMKTFESGVFPVYTKTSTLGVYIDDNTKGRKFKGPTRKLF